VILTPTTPSFSLAGLLSPATVAESIFVKTSGLPPATSVSYYLDNQLISTETQTPFWLGGQNGGALMDIR
jgi:hypothetical protein